MAAAVLLVDVISAYLLGSQLRDTGDARHLAWYIGFPVLLGVAWGYPRRWDALIEAHRRRRVSLGAFWSAPPGRLPIVIAQALPRPRWKYQRSVKP